MSLTTEELAQIVNVSGLKAALKASGNKGVYNFATCSTAAGTAAKVIDTAPTSFKLTSGAVIIVKFSNAISVANATLKVGSSGTAKAIYYRGAALAANKVAAGAQLMLRYNGTQYDIIGDLDTDTTYSTMVTGTSLTAENVILGNGSSTIKSSGKTLETTLTDSSSKIPVSSAVKAYVDSVLINPISDSNMTASKTWAKRDCVNVDGEMYYCDTATSEYPKKNIISCDGDIVEYNGCYIILDNTLSANWHSF